MFFILYIKHNHHLRCSNYIYLGWIVNAQQGNSTQVDVVQRYFLLCTVHCTYIQNLADVVQRYFTPVSEHCTYIQNIADVVQRYFLPVYSVHISRIWLMLYNDISSLCMGAWYALKPTYPDRNRYIQYNNFLYIKGY